MSTVPTGDQGQRYEVSFYDPHTCTRQVLGWTSEAEGLHALVTCINLHPRWEQPEVKDRQTPPLSSTFGLDFNHKGEAVVTGPHAEPQNVSGPEHLAPKPAPGLEFDARGVLGPKSKTIKKRPLAS